MGHLTTQKNAINYDLPPTRFTTKIYESNINKLKKTEKEGNYQPGDRAIKVRAVGGNETRRKELSPRNPVKTAKTSATEGRAIL